jgi:bla regulator protein blaR1
VRAALAVALAGVCLAQTPRSPAFDVVSIRPYDGTSELVGARTSPGGLVMVEGTTVLAMITSAYGVRRHQVEGLPGWADADRYNINARAEGISGELTPDEVSARMRSLLETRFGLRIRRETREMPIFVLVAGKSGAKLKAATNSDHSYRIARGMIASANTGISTLAAVLSQQAGRPVVDKTGIPGSFEVRLLWADPGASTPEEQKIAAVAQGRSLATALDEELGLRLEPQRGPVELLIVEHLNRPSPN